MNDGSSTPTQRQQELFFAALAYTDPGARDMFLDTACADDSALRGWVEEELRRQTTPLPFSASDSTGAADTKDTTYSATAGWETPTEEDAVSPEAAALIQALKPEEAGDHIGPFRLVERLGEGGFGAVWMAEQAQPVRRQVALKIIRLGMNSREIVARFAQERQALAMMDHPGIAKVLDAGTTPFGRPFFVMELVRGTPITEFCDEYTLPVRQRLEMMMRVCSAVQHAHQKGIIHRDLKPTNVLVTVDQDGVASPKVIDFGIAKATEQQRLTELTLATQHGLLLGTPLYMSPEQAEMKGEDIDTRSDIYSLGVLLYVLLTGRTPIDREQLDAASLDEMGRIVREAPLPRPTAALAALPRAELEEVATQRSSPAQDLIHGIRGDLEWICMKMLEKDRRRRYPSASAVAADLQRLLLNEPITARPPSRRYLVNKFIERHQRAMRVTSVILALLFLGIISNLKEALRAEESERRAVALERASVAEAKQANELRARAEVASLAAQLNAHVAGVSLAQQSLANGNLGRARQVLDRLRPGPGETDLRGFAWRYLWALTRGEASRTFPRLDSPAAALAYSPDGSLLAVGGLDEVAVFDVKNRQQIAKLSPGSGSLGFLPDGGTLVTVGGGRVHLWQTTNWTEKSSWEEGPGPLALSHDGTRLAVACADGIRVRDTTAWKETRFLSGAMAPLAFSADGKTLASDATDGITLWRLEDGKAARVLANSRGLFTGEEFTFFRPIQVLAFSPDGNTVAAPQNWLSAQGAFVLRFWDAHTGRETATLPDQPERPEHTGIIASLAFSPDGQQLATTSLDHSVRLWDLSRSVCTDAFQGHQAEVGGCVFSPDGRTLASGDRLGYVKAWKLGQPKAEETLFDVQRPLAVSSDGNTLAMLTAGSSVVFCDAATNVPRRTFPLEPTREDAGAAVAVSADLRQLAQGLDDGKVRISDTSTGASRLEYVSGRDVNYVALTPDGQTLVSGARGQFLRSRNLKTGREANLPFEARRVVISPDSKLLALISSDAGQENTSAPDGPLAQGKGATDPALKPLAPDRSEPKTPGRRGGHGAPVNPEGVPLWDLSANKLRVRLNVSVHHVLDGAFSPDGRRFATALSDNTVQLWDTGNGKRLGVLAGHKQVVTAVAFANDGQSLATASEDGTLRLWNIQAQQEVLSIQNLGWRAGELLFSPDGRALIMAVKARGQPPQLRFYRAPLLTDIDREMQK